MQSKFFSVEIFVILKAMNFRVRRVFFYLAMKDSQACMDLSLLENMTSYFTIICICVLDSQVHMFKVMFSNCKRKFPNAFHIKALISSRWLSACRTFQWLNMTINGNACGPHIVPLWTTFETIQMFKHLEHNFYFKQNTYL